MKKLYLLLLSAAMLITCSCGDTENRPKDNVSMTTLESAIKAQIKSDLIASGENTQNDFKGDILPSYNSVFLTDGGFDIPVEADTSCLEDAVAIMHIDPSYADLIMILKAKQGRLSDAETIARALREHQLEQSDAYTANQINKIEANIIKDTGNYVIYITYDDPKAMDEAISKVIR